MKTSVALAALLLVSSVSHADPQRVAPFQKKQAQTRDNGKPHPFNARDLVMLDRVGDPQLSPDGKRVAFQLRETDYAENKGVTSIWMLDLGARNADPVRLAPTFVASGARWSPDGKYIYFIGKPKGGQLTGVYRVDAADDKAAPEALTPYRVDVNNFKLSPDGTKLLLSIDVEPACAATLCVDAKNPVPTKASGKLYDKLFVRHWDTWADGKRSQLFITDVNPTAAKASMVPRPKLLSKGIDGDVPSKPFGDETEYAFSPDGKTVYFDVRIAGRTEPWSTNFDIYSVPADASSAPQNLTASNPAWDAFPLPSADGKTLYYARDETPRFRSRSLRHHGARSGQRKIARSRSAVGSFGRRHGAVEKRQDHLRDDRRRWRSRPVRHRHRERQGDAHERSGTGRRFQRRRRSDHRQHQHAENAGGSVPPRRARQAADATHAFQRRTPRPRPDGRLRVLHLQGRRTTPPCKATSSNRSPSIRTRSIRSPSSSTADRRAR